MKDLIILGAGDVGGYLAYNIHNFPDYKILGFLDDDTGKHGKVYYNYKVLGGIDFDQWAALNTAFAICIYSTEVKRKLYSKAKHKDLDFPNFISPNAWISPGCQIGKGNIIYPGVSINFETTIGDFVHMNMNCAIGHNSTVESFSSLAPGVNLGGFSKLGEGVTMGIGSSTVQGIEIGENAMIGGQSMVTNSLSKNSKVAGVPAREL